MKKLVLTLAILTAFALVGMAQSNYYPLIQEDKSQQWNVVYIIAASAYPDVYSTDIQSIDGDVALEGVDYKLVWTDNVYDALKIAGAIREENRRVYFRRYYGGYYENEVLLYDFNLNVGDTVTVNWLSTTLMVLEESEVEVDGVMRRRLGLGYPTSIPELGEIEEYWIEGVGSTFGFLNSGYGSSSWVGSFPHLLCYYENDNLIWDNEDFDECVMNSDGNEASGPEWYYEIENEDGSITYQHLECAADTTVNGKEVVIIIRTNTLYDKSEHSEVTREYLYEEDDVVYWWNPTLQEFTVLYDYGAEEGDEWEIKVGAESITMHVDGEENIEYEGNIFRTLLVSDEDDIFSGIIVCGIGHLTSFFPERLMTRCENYRVEGMRCYWLNGELVFKYGDRDCDEVYQEYHNGLDESAENQFNIYPNPTNDVLVVETRRATSLLNQTYNITNLMGQTLQSGTITAETQQIDVSVLPEGMYFISIGDMTRKFVVNK
jgi:hypothetical protein